MKNKLVMSAPSKEKLLEMITNYFYCKPNTVEITEEICVSTKTRKEVYTGTVYKSGKKLDNYVVKRNNGRYRFERVLV
jgi:hypothetical protein